jgi:NADH-quinone oxidoreductase subunit D
MRLAARVDGFSGMVGDLAYALAVESLLRVTPPPRAQMLRAIYAECARLASHLYWLAHMTQAYAAPAYIAPARAWQARKAVLDLIGQLGDGSPIPDVISIGGLDRDAPAGFRDALLEYTARLNGYLDEIQTLVHRQDWVRRQLDGIGVIDPGTALGLGVTGPNLRACGVPYDVRTAFPYAGYTSVEIPVPVHQDGDAKARFLVRMSEMRASLEIIRQAASLLHPGAVNAFETADLPDALPAGTAYAAVEGPRGEWGILLVSEGRPHWQYAYIRGPSFANLSALPFLCRNMQPDHLTSILGSLDVSVGEVER